MVGVLAPFFAYAQTGTAPKIRLTNPSSGLTLDGLVKMFVGLLNSLTGLFLTVAIIAFFWGLVRYIYYAGDVKGRKKGRDTIVWGLIGLFVVVALAGILEFLKGVLPL
ncbi:hypothetical protein A2419_00390 [Candidatus Adlerbacteria bacterium RIFOXYC1_FULL_48_26]|uniref:DUF4134 domain-containing protein n=1 Tax=Candidatus Adlerbacteria bacterium RIFOXYC1_FULL_48_26 TaxID=1797247 RepID=A0A1F4Y2V9_9BACT|nr:MAG: hypothetical protein A2419_00390 [Candidatus Adlerbacteria bacterium RIFOXYC1_FULL_48_26]